MGTQPPARGAANRRRASIERERGLAALAKAQHGVVSRRQLLLAGLGVRTIKRRVEAGRLHLLHRGVYVFGHGYVSLRGEWMGAVLACGHEALLSHRSAAVLWGLGRPRQPAVEVTATNGRGRPGIRVHEGGVHRDERTTVDGIPVTSVARTIFDLAEVVNVHQLELMFEEADRLGLLDLRALEDVCSRGYGRRALRPIRRLIETAQLPEPARSSLEASFLRFCREHGLPSPQTNVTVLGYEVDAFWPGQRLVVEIDGWSFHRHRAAFERDRARDAAMQAEGYRVLRITHRRLEREPDTLAAELGRLLSPETGRAGT